MNIKSLEQAIKNYLISQGYEVRLVDIQAINDKDEFTKVISIASKIEIRAYKGIALPSNK